MAGLMSGYMAAVAALCYSPSNPMVLAPTMGGTNRPRPLANFKTNQRKMRRRWANQRSNGQRVR